LGGVQPHPEWLHQPGRIWVDVGGRPDSIRVYAALCPDKEQAPLIYLEGDAMGRSNKATGPISVGAWYTRLSPFSVQVEAEQLTTAFGRPFLNLARPGVFGSSGDHRERRREREVALIDAALDRLKDKFGWTHLHLVGQSGGGHLVAALIARRSDIGCAVIASGNVAVRRRNLMRGMPADATGYNDFVDPIELVSDVARHPPTQTIVLTDPNDAVVPAALQTAYVQELRNAGVRVEQRMVQALDPNNHILRYPAILAAASAANAHRCDGIR
jgi:dienelactone hydrolase